MHACVLHAVGDLRCEQVARPTPGAGQVLVRVAACGVCGSDIPRVFTTGTYRFPLIPGHEFSGEVVEAGNGADTLLVGTRATVFPLIPCKACSMCAAGEYALCTAYDYLGSRSNGAFAEYVIAPAWNVLPVPDSVSLEEAALTEPAAVALHALRRSDMVPGDNVLVMGAGPIGLLTAMWARALGADSVVLVDIDKQKTLFAQSIGFSHTIDARAENVAEAAGAMVPAGIDLVVEASGSPEALEQGLTCAKPFGRVVLLGNPCGDMRLAKDSYWAILRKQLRVSGSWNSTYNPGTHDDWRTTIEYMASGKLDARPLITHRVALPGLLMSMKKMRDRSEFSNKVLVVNSSYEEGADPKIARASDMLRR